MKEKGIIFTGDSIPAIQEGRKIQTRRVIKPQPNKNTYPNHQITSWKEISGAWFPVLDNKIRAMQYWKCPYGQPGDRLWVRETWGPIDSLGYGFPKNRPYKETVKEYREKCTADHIIYRADGEERVLDEDDPDGIERSPWKPSIHMPRWASRITLEVTGVRVERVQDIDEVDAIAEGVFVDNLPDLKTMRHPYAEHFKYLWDSINNSRGFGWDVNPLVCVIEFKKVD